MGIVCVVCVVRIVVVVLVVLVVLVGLVGLVALVALVVLIVLVDLAVDARENGGVRLLAIKKGYPGKLSLPSSSLNFHAGKSLLSILHH